ncbi:DMT family transporter [Sporolactobacillus sp. CQH2019]|uniref:DMT family transporter n=1 Tax=Sporolactobacillus sp. CQH2019 TaxID=3023512 RepID=UPI00236810E4|nr:DMT family transporter [Sporolactobacillus sp. CQH2019]MDD9150092.1 DMT family transporter [Sporolactobacillus sp. CQH2019]
MGRLRGIIFIIAAADLFGIMPVWVKLAYTTGLTVFGVVFLRSGIAAAILGILLFCRKIDFHIGKPQLDPLLLLSTLGYTATIFTLYLSYKYISAGVATSLHYLYPVLVMLLGYLMYRKKRPQVYKCCALLMSLIGIYLIADRGGGDFSLKGVGLAISSAAFFAIYVLSINYPQLKKLDSLMLAFYDCLMTTIISLAVLVVQAKWPPKITLKGLYYTGLISFFCTVLALLVFIEGVKIIGSVSASILSTLEPVVSLVSGIIVLHEPITWYTSLGCILIITSVILIAISDLKRGAAG